MTSEQQFDADVATLVRSRVRDVVVEKCAPALHDRWLLARVEFTIDLPTTIWNRDETRLQLEWPLGYPHALPEGLTLANGSRPWMFSRQRHDGPFPIWCPIRLYSWNPNHDNLLTYAQVVRLLFQHFLERRDPFGRWL